MVCTEKRALGKVSEPADMRIKLKLPKSSGSSAAGVVVDFVTMLTRDKFEAAAPNATVVLETDSHSDFLECLRHDLANASGMFLDMFEIQFPLSVASSGDDFVVSLQARIVADHDLRKDPMAIASDLEKQVDPGTRVCDGCCNAAGLSLRIMAVCFALAAAYTTRTPMRSGDVTQYVGELIVIGKASSNEHCRSNCVLFPPSRLRATAVSDRGQNSPAPVSKA